MTDPRRFGLGVSAGELPGDLRPIRPREPRPEHDPLHPPRPPAGVEFRCPLGATAAISLNLQAVHGRSLRSMPPSTPPDGSAAAEAVPIIPSDLPGTSPRAGTVTAYRRPRGPSLEEVTLGAEGPLGAPTYRGIEDVQEPNHQEAGHPGTFPNRPERNAAGPTSSPNRTAEGRAQEPNRQEAGHPGTFPNRQERNATGLGGTRNRAAEGRAQEPNRQEAGHPGTFPNRQERNATGLGGTRNRAAEGRAQEPNRQEAGHPGTFPNRQERNATGLGGTRNRAAEGRAQEPNRQEAGHPGTFPNRPERNATGLGGTRNRAAEGRAQEPNRQEAGHPGTFPDRQERNATGLGGTRNRAAEGRAQEANRQEAGHPGTFPNRQERNATGLGGTRNRAAEGRGAWRPGVLQPEERGPASLLRADRYPCLLPLASAGPARRHRPGRLARSRAATRGLGLRGLAARVFGPRESRRQSRLPASVGTLSVRVSSFTTVMSRTVPSAWRTAWTRSTTWRICERSPSTFVPEAWVSIIRPDSLSSSCARWTSRRTETPAPIGIAWISAVVFMGLEVKGLTWYRAALTAAYHASVRPPRDRCDRTRPVPHTRLIDPIGGGISLVR